MTSLAKGYFKFPPKCLTGYRYIVQQHHKYCNIIYNKQSTAFPPTKYVDKLKKQKTQ